jgi:hypothetical protein
MKLLHVSLLCVLVLGMTGCASRRRSARAATPSDPAAEQQAQELEARNEALRAELSRKRSELQQSFSAATEAETAAGLRGLGCAVVSPAAAAAPALPRPGSTHAQFTLRRQPYRMTATFAAPRTTGGWRVAQGTCTVVTP